MPIKNSLNGLPEVIGLNSLTLSVTTFTNIELALKIILLLVSIIYTITKLSSHFRNKNGKK
jgi:hypothetical protein